MTVRAHHQQIEFAGVGHLGNGLGHGAGFPLGVSGYAVAGQVFAHWIEHLMGIERLLAVNEFLVQRAARAERPRRLCRENGVVGLCAKQTFMGRQVGQHFLGVGTAVHGQHDFHCLAPESQTQCRQRPRTALDLRQANCRSSNARRLARGGRCFVREAVVSQPWRAACCSWRYRP